MAHSVADLTIDEFRNLIKEVVTQTILEIFNKPDEGLELHDDIKERLHHSLAVMPEDREVRSAADVAAKFGVEW